MLTMNHESGSIHVVFDEYIHIHLKSLHIKIEVLPVSLADYHSLGSNQSKRGKMIRNSP